MCDYTIRAYVCGCRAAGVRLAKLCQNPREGCEGGPHILILPRRCDDARKHIDEEH